MEYSYPHRPETQHVDEMIPRPSQPLPRSESHVSLIERLHTRRQRWRLGPHRLALPGGQAPLLAYLYKM